jgi:ubiquinone biosynthesis protein
VVFKEAVGDLNRLRQILGVIVKHGFGDMLDRARIFERLKIRKPHPEEDRARAPAERLVRMLTELGPTFIKMGQLLSTRPDVIPEEYINALRTLQDQAPPFPYSEVVRIVSEELGDEPDKLFSEFETEPCASASIAQVHRATTIDGRKVVVKVKRPGIERTVKRSLDIVYYLAHMIEAIVEEGALYNPAGIVREFDRAIGLEMDLDREAKSLRTFYNNFRERQTLIIPEPLEDLSGPSVLTMDRLEGQHVNEIEPGSQLARQAAMNLIEGFYQQTFEDGFFHADPHPGNFLIMADGKIGLMDFGQIGTLNQTQRSTLVLLGLGIILKDADTVSRLVYRIGSQTRRADLGQLKKDIKETLESSLEAELGQIDSAKVLGRLLDLSWDHQVRIPAEYTLATKAMVTVEGIVRKLYPSLEPAAVATPYVKKLLVEHYSLDDIKGGVGRALLQLSNLLNEVPQQVSQILMDLESGRMSVQINDPESSLKRKTLRGVGIDLFWGLVATGLLAGSLPAMMSPEPAPAAAIWGLVGSGIIAMIVTLRYFFTPALRKMRVRHWLERRWGDKDHDDKKIRSD